MPFYAVPMEHSDTNNTLHLRVVWANNWKESQNLAAKEWAGPFTIHYDDIREATPEEVDTYFRELKAYRFAEARMSEIAIPLAYIEQGTYEGRPVTSYNKSIYQAEAMKKALKFAFEEGWKRAKDEDAHKDNYYKREPFYSSSEPYGDYD